MATPPFQASNTEFAYQLRYHFGFQVRRRRPVFASDIRSQSLTPDLRPGFELVGVAALAS